MYVLGMTSNITMDLNVESLDIINSFCAVPDIQDLIWWSFTSLLCDNMY